MFRFKVEPDHEEAYEVEALERDVLVWEKAGRGRSLESLMKNMTMTAVYEIAHATVKRVRGYDKSLATFEETVNLKLLKSDDVADAADPTQREASPDSP